MGSDGGAAMSVLSVPPRNPAGLRALVAALNDWPGGMVQTGESHRAHHCHTTTWLTAQPPDAVVFPRDTADVQRVVRLCADHRIPVIPFGAGTSLEGHVNAPGGGICLDFRDMAAVLAVNAEDMDCRVQPGITRKQLNAHLRDTGLFFPVDPGADASLGGMASTRASGTNAVRYGTMRDAVLGLKVVLPDGEIATTANRARKTSAGYDLSRLLIGAEGTLGIITELTLRLHGIPEAVSAASCCFETVEQACNTVIESVLSGIGMARIELLDALSVTAVNRYSKLALPEAPMLLLEFHGSPESVREQASRFGEIAGEHGGHGFEWAEQAEDRARLWQARHDAYWACRALRPGVQGLSTDICVPVSALAECVTRAQERAAELDLVAPVLGHAGDGNFHMILLVDTENSGEKARAKEYVEWLSRLAIERDGSCTGEHGIGQGKAGMLQSELGPEAVGMMRAIKRAIDPQNIMNPGKIFDLGN